MRLANPRGPVGVVDELELMARIAEVKAWLVQHGLAPDNVRRHVELLGDGHVQVEVMERDRRGAIIADPGGPRVRIVRIAPQRPFPVTVTRSAGAPGG